MDTLVNKVAESGIVTLNMEHYMPQSELIAFDIKDFLFMGLILKEKDFREALKQLHKEDYNNKIVCVHCSADAIVPLWAYMLVAVTLQGHAAAVHYGTLAQVQEQVWCSNIAMLNASEYTDKRVVVKGCGDVSIPASVYMAITTQLLPHTKSIMYGEPCSTVPLYKKK